MDDSKKKLIMVIIVVICVVGAGAIFMRGTKDTTDKVIEHYSGREIWVKCKSCGATYTMDEGEYIKWKRENQDGMYLPGMECKECGKEAAYKAFKCENCGHVDFYKDRSSDYPDRCPECGYSSKEEARKAKRNK